MTGSANSARRSRQSRTVLLATDSKNSVLAEVLCGKPNPIAYSVYGEQSAQQEIAARPGFNGQLREARLGWYLLGNGYRAYNPVLMRFHSPDSWSPFGEGGLNAYMYRVGDPVNASDPTGHVRLFGLLRGTRRQLGSAPSTSSLTPLVPDISGSASTATPITTPVGQTQTGITNPNFIDDRAAGQTKPSLAAKKHSNATTRNLSDHATRNETPPPIPPKRQIPRFNDSGGQVAILSPSQNAGEPGGYMEIWRSEPFQHPIAPVPPRRTLRSGVTRHYYVTYDVDGSPMQSSVEKVDLSQLQRKIRKTQE